MIKYLAKTIIENTYGRWQKLDETIELARIFGIDMTRQDFIDYRNTNPFLSFDEAIEIIRERIKNGWWGRPESIAVLREITRVTQLKHLSDKELDIGFMQAIEGREE